MAKPKKLGGPKQKLSPIARAAKIRRDNRASMSPWGKFKKRTAQKIDCPKGYDFDHDSGECVPSSKNRKKNNRSGKVKNLYGY